MITALRALPMFARAAGNATSVQPRNDRRSAGAYDIILRAFLKARAWQGPRRALLEALPDGGHIIDATTFATVLDRLGFRSTWRRTTIAHLSEADAPALVLLRGEPVLVGQIEPDGRARVIAPFATTLPRGTPVRALIVSEAHDFARASATDVFAAAREHAVAIAGLTGPSLIWFAAAPALIAAAIAGALDGRFAAAAIVALAALFAADAIARLARQRQLAEIAATVEARAAGLAAECAFEAPLRAPRRPGAWTETLARLRGLGAFVRSGGANAALDVPAVVAGCLGALLIGGVAAAAPTLAAMALGLLVLSDRRKPSAEAATEPSFAEKDRDASRRLVAGTIVIIGHAGIIAACVQAGAGVASIAGLAAALHLATRPLVTLAGESAVRHRLRDALETIAALDVAPRDRRRTLRSSPAPAGAIAVTNVRFRYPDAETMAIDGVSFKLAQGDVVALRGEAGAGKSTLFSLLAGLDTPLTGTVAVGGRDLKRVDPITHRAAIGLVPPDPVFPAGTIAGILRRLAPDSDDTIRRGALDAAGFVLDAELFPNGVDTLLAVNDPRLTPERRLRLALAGALARRPALLLLDIPPQLLTPQIAELIVKQMRALRGRTTIICATEHAAIIREADTVIELDRGQMVSIGPPILVAPEVTLNYTPARLFGRA